MPLITTPGAPDANSYATADEVQAYLDTRRLVPEWDDTDEDTDALIIMATRVIDTACSPVRRLVRDKAGSYYLTSPSWTGVPATETQALCWPRIGMRTRNGVVIPSNVIPVDLKNAVAELAAQLAKGDRTADNDVAVQGITSISAGSVSLGFKSDVATTKIIPDAVIMLLVPSWLSDEIMDFATQRFEFEVI